QALEQAADADQRPSLRTLHPPDAKTGARERRRVRPDRVHVLVDAQLLLGFLLRGVAAREQTARSLVQRAHEPSSPRHPRQLAHQRTQFERVVQRRDAERQIEDLVGEREVFGVGLHARKLTVDRAATETDPRVRERVRAHVRAAARQQVWRSPALRGADLECAHPLLEVAVAEHRERVRVRAPELAGKRWIRPRQLAVDRIVRLVPAFALRLRDPAVHLALLRARAREVVMEEERDAALDGKGARAFDAREPRRVLADAAPADRATEDLQQRRVQAGAERYSAVRPALYGHTQPLNSPRLAFGLGGTGGSNALWEARVRFAVVAVGLPVTALTIWAVVRSPLGRRVVAAPRLDRWHTRATPLLGGVGIFAGFAAGLGACLAIGAAPASKELLGILAGAAILFVAGLADDVFSLGPVPKLAAQVLAACCVLVAGLSIQMIGNDVLADVIAVLWLVGMTNAFNLLDNMDGLAATLAAIAATFFAIDAVTTHPSHASLALALALALACIAFLPFNLRPRSAAVVFMG